MKQHAQRRHEQSWSGNSPHPHHIKSVRAYFLLTFDHHITTAVAHPQNLARGHKPDTFSSTAVLRTGAGGYKKKSISDEKVGDVCCVYHMLCVCVWMYHNLHVTCIIYMQSVSKQHALIRGCCSRGLCARRSLTAQRGAVLCTGSSGKMEVSHTGTSETC